MKRNGEWGIALVCLASLLLVGCTKLSENKAIGEETESMQNTEEVVIKTMGEVTAKMELMEQEITLPWGEAVLTNGFFEREDGTWVVYNNQGDLGISTNGGKSFTAQPRTEIKEWITEKSKLQNYNYANTELTAKGYGITWACVFEHGDDEFDRETFYGEQTIHYAYEKEGNKIATEGTLTFPPKEYLLTFILGTNGEVFYCANSKVYELNVSTGKSTLLFQAENIERLFLKNQVIIAWGTKEVVMYDYVQGEVVSTYPALKDFLLQKGGNVAMGEGEENSVYLLREDGLFRYILGGSTIELIHDGHGNSLLSQEDADYQLVASPKPGVFILSPVYGKLYLYTSEKVEKAPTKTLTLYRLREERYDIRTIYRDMEVAINKYEKLHSEIKIEIELGMPPADEESAVMVNDVIKQLNLELASGQGPDLLLLDNLPVESYVEKGILADISEVVHTVDEKEGLLPQIVKHYKDDDGNMYQIPLGFTTNVVWMPQEYLEESRTLEGFAKMAQHSGEENKEDWVVMLPSISGLGGYAESLAPTCMKAWIREDGSINKEGLAEFYEQLGSFRILEENNSVYDQEYESEKSNDPELTKLEFIKQYSGGLEAIKKYRSTKNSNIKDPGLLVTEYFAVTGIGEVGSGIGGLYLSELERAMGESGKWNIDFEVFLGQQGKNVFNPSRIIGINQTSENVEEAKQFLEFLLSEESNYGIEGPDEISEEKGEERNGNNRPIFPINQKVLEYDYQRFNVSNDQMKKIKTMIATLEEPSMSYEILLNVVIEEGAQVLWKEKTPKEATDAVEQRMEVYLVE